MTIDDLVVGQKAMISVTDSKKQIEREVTVLEKDIFNPLTLVVSSIHEETDEKVKALVILDYGVIKLNASLPEGYYCGTVTNVKLVRRGNEICYKLKFGTPQLSRVNRRKYKRYPIMADAEMTVEGSEKPIVGFLKDISFAGICFAISEEGPQLDAGTKIQVTITHHDASMPLHVCGVIKNMRSELLEENRVKTYYGIALACEYEQIRGLVTRVERRGLKLGRHENEKEKENPSDMDGRYSLNKFRSLSEKEQRSR